jgi:hypothetical protein
MALQCLSDLFISTKAAELKQVYTSKCHEAFPGLGTLAALLIFTSTKPVCSNRFTHENKILENQDNYW